MKKILYIIALAVLTLSGCNKEPQGNNPASALCGEWQSLTSGTDVAIYLSFAANGEFNLYQNLKGTGYEIFRGKWSLEDNLLSGEYNDGESWAYSYTIMYHDEFLTLTTTGDETAEYTFIRTKIPNIIKETGNVIVKSSY